MQPQLDGDPQQRVELLGRPRREQSLTPDMVAATTFNTWRPSSSPPGLAHQLSLIEQQ